MSANTYGRQVVLGLTNKSGGSVAAGDVVIVDTGNNDAFTTTTTAGFTGGVGIVQSATIPSNAVGLVLTQGYAALINVNASVTRGHFGKTHTVAKQATDAGTARGTGTFVQFLTGGTTPDGLVYPVDLLGSSLINPMTTTGDLIYSSDNSGTPARLGLGAAGGAVSRVNGALAWNSGTSFPSAATGDRYWRTDLGMEAYYDGTRWLTTQVLEMNGTPLVFEGQTTSQVLAHLTPWGTAYDIWMVRFDASLRVSTTNDGTRFWAMDLRLLTSGNTVTSTPSTFNTSAIAADTTTKFSTVIGAQWTVATDPIADILLTKTSTPGALTYCAFSLKYRLVLT